MSYRFPSVEWTNAYREAINANQAYREAAQDWTHGIVAMVVEKEPSVGLAESMALHLDVERGKCRSCLLVKADEVHDASFVIVGTYAQWKQVVKKEIDPIKAMLQGKLQLVKGHMPTIIKYVKASKELVASIACVPTQFPDES
ncbi:SCP2 sterol-binding domain-containing protein [Pajaroellobacter abortibovis]|uniref:SCP2 domain-containing protein n=1 Tax=Pajaroellobacter abortibovis TaxID=1882918 RepID=A0A1L6MYQ9_9BACT|nr:SCP2 sterol-binding domain-containing protein [Pajaroellobacter abortibovis]APS00555.1 hypothetical protein BCY86_07595 [Pajaroellobacter abortibovis]